MPEVLNLDIRFTVGTRIDRAPAEVFDALVDPLALSSYYTATASGPLFPKAHVQWTWANGDADEIEVVEIEAASRIALRWKAAHLDDRILVTISLHPEADGSTGVTVTESGWRAEPLHVVSSFEHCAQWQHMLTCLKAWLEHGIDLRH